ncbi:hypothetical protein GCM10009720_07590 [Yaniella flava]|uniref:SipW-cognate class signal peptide n=1 Tax=Yaniella flava TaxID=287930 RepID=A0ABP5FMP7_9MICC|nr:hypothetical protein [Micrococcaceae bacterium]
MTSTTRTSQRRRHITGAVVVLVALIVGLSFTRDTPVGSTTAAWSADESATGVLQAAEIPAPTLTRDCQFRPGLLGLGARVRIFWDIPDGYTFDDVEVSASTSGLGSLLEPLTGFNLTGNTETTDDGYRTDVPTNLLGGLLGLGSELEIAIKIQDPQSDWTSETTSVASNAGLIGGIGGNCRNLS